MKGNREKLVFVLESVFSPLIKALTDNPEYTSIEYEYGDPTLIVRIKTPSTEVGKILGVKGRTINGLRTILYRLSGKYGVKTILEIKK